MPFETQPAVEFDVDERLNVITDTGGIIDDFDLQ
jgi:hypothetical protein